MCLVKEGSEGREGRNASREKEEGGGKRDENVAFVQSHFLILV